MRIQMTVMLSMTGREAFADGHLRAVVVFVPGLRGAWEMALAA